MPKIVALATIACAIMVAWAITPEESEHVRSNIPHKIYPKNRGRSYTPRSDVMTVVQLTEDGMSVNDLVKRFSTVLMLVSDSQQHCGPECVHYLQHFVRTVARIEEEGFDAIDVVYSQFLISRSRKDYERMRRVMSAKHPGVKMPMPAAIAIVERRIVGLNVTVAPADGSIVEGISGGGYGTDGAVETVEVLAEGHWMNGVPRAAFREYDTRMMTVKQSIEISGIPHHANRSYIVWSPDESLAEELPAFIHRYSGPAVKTVISEEQLRFRIFEAQHADKIAFVLWEPPESVANRQFPAERDRRLAVRAAFEQYARRNRLRFTFSVTSFASVEHHADMASRYNMFRHDIVAYVLDRDAHDSYGYRPVGFNVTSTTKRPLPTEAEKRAKHVLAAMTEFADLLMLERHTPRRTALEIDREEYARTGRYNASRSLVINSFHEPRIACATRRVVPGDTIRVIVRGRSLQTGVEFLHWPAPGVVLTVGISDAGLPRTLHQMFVGMCVGMRRQVNVVKPPKAKPRKGRQEPWSVLVTDDGETYAIEMLGFFNPASLSFKGQWEFDMAPIVAKWREEELRQWDRVERNLIAREGQSRAMW